MQGEPDHQEDGQPDLSHVGGLSDRQALGEVVQPDARGDRHAEVHGPLPEVERGLGDRHGPGPDGGVGPPGPLPPAEVQEGEQPHPKAECEHDPEARHPAPSGTLRARIDRLEGVGQDVHHEEQQDARGGRVEECFQHRARIAQPAERKPQEDRRAGDRPEQDDPSSAHS